MRLPESVYNQVLRGLGIESNGISDCVHEDRGTITAHGPAPAPAECKRRSRRRRLDAAVRFIRHGALNSKSQTCTLVDVSRDGVCVLMDTVVAPGDQFVLYLPRAAREAGPRDEPLAILCTARSSRLKNNGKFRTGAEFADAQEVESEKKHLVLSAGGLSHRTGGDTAWARTAARPDGSPDRTTRRTDRQEAFGRATMYVYRDDGRHGPMEEIELRDYSESGVGILRSRPMGVGEQFVVRVPRAGDKPITRLCRVVNVALAGGRHRIGAEFIPFPGPGGRTFMSKLTNWIA